MRVGGWRPTRVKKCVWNIRHGKMSLKHSSKITYIIRLFLSLLSYKIPSKIISCSILGAKVHKNIGYVKDKFEIVHNGIDLKFLNKNISILNKKKIIKIASIGRDNPQKNRKYFIEIIRNLEDLNSFKVEPYIVGRGIKESREISEILLFNPLKIKLLESKKSITKLFSKIDIILITSIYGEGCPNILIEAMLSGVLIFSTDVGDSKYILGDKQFIISNDDPLAAADKIIKVIKNSNLKNLIFNNRERALKLFNEEKMVSKYNAIWDSI